MPTPQLPVADKELVRLLNRPLTRPDHRSVNLTVDSAQAREGIGPTKLGLELAVRVSTPARGRESAWTVVIPLDPLDIAEGMTPQAFVATMRANLEEWWACKDTDPEIARWGTAT